MNTVTISEIAFTSIRGVTFWPASGKPNRLSASNDAIRSEVRWPLRLRSWPGTREWVEDP